MLFSIDQISGIVRVNRPLDYSVIARYTVGIQVVDNNAAQNDQTANATLIIEILEVNTQGPVFRVTNGESQENQPTGSYVMTLVATDATNAIAEYRIVTDPGNNFQVNSQTGK